MLKFLKSLNGELFQIAGIAASVLLLIWIYSCRPSAQSLLSPPSRVSRAELFAEVEMFKARFEDRMSDLDRQEAFRSLVFDQASLLSSGGTLNPVGIFTSLGTILGIGAVADNVRKRKVISELTSSK